MTAIGGKHRTAKRPTQPQWVIESSRLSNQFMLLGQDDKGHTTIAWIGDPYNASKFNSKYEAKNRTRELADIPETRHFKVLA